jgi:hypothetical protein
MDKIGDVYLRAEKSRCCAYWRPAVGGPEIFLGAVDSTICERHPHVRDLFVELIAEIAVNRERAKGRGVTLRAREPLPQSFRYPQPFPDERAD